MPLLVGLAWGSAASSEPPDYARTPVLFVHGHGLSSADWRPLIEHLAVTGYPREYLHAVDIVPNTMANVRAATSVIAPEAEALLARAEAAARRAGYSGKVSRRLDIVSHSMGVVSSRWYAAKLRPDLVRTWIGLAGANHGTQALCPFRDEASREMCPAFATNARAHPLQVALNGTEAARVDETPYGLGLDRPGVARVPPDSTRSISSISRSASSPTAGFGPSPAPSSTVRGESPSRYRREYPRKKPARATSSFEHGSGTIRS